MSADEPPPILRQLDLLLTGYGFNYYNDKNKMRSDDLLVRQKAAALLGDAASALTAMEAEFQRRYVPPSTREQPFPPREVLDSLRDLENLRAKVQDLAAAIRSMPVPAQDKVWWRLRSERALLDRLLQYDLALVGQAQQAAQRISGLTADTWQHEHPYGQCMAELRPLEDAIRDRKALLQIHA